MIRGETWAKISGLHKQAKKGRTYFGLVRCKALFGPCEAVARSLQSRTSSAFAALECIKVLRQWILAFRENNLVKQLTDKMNTCAAQNNLEMPPHSRVSKTPARLRNTTEAEAVVCDSGEAQWRRQFYKALDLVKAGLDRIFDQEGMRVAVQRETTVIGAANGNLSGLNEVQLPKRIDRSRLQMQLILMGNLAKEGKNIQFCPRGCQISCNATSTNQGAV